MTVRPSAGTDPDEDRWAEALSVLEQRPTAAAGRRRRQRRTRTWLLVAALLALSAAAGLLVAVLGLHAFDDGTAPVASWREETSTALVAVGLVVEVVGLVGLVRAGLWGARWRSPSTLLTRHQRRQLMRVVSGRVPVDARVLPLARDLAEHQATARVLVVMHAGMAVMQGGQTLTHTAWGWFAAALVVVVLLGISAVLLERQGRRARRFLQAHPASAGEPLAEEG